MLNNIINKHLNIFVSDLANSILNELHMIVISKRQQIMEITFILREQNLISDFKIL